VTAHDGGIATDLIGRCVAWYGDRGREGGPIVAVWAPGGRAVLLVAVVNEDGKIVTKDAASVIVDGHS